MTRARRVAVTGLGVITPLGIGTDSFWRHLRAGQSGITPITRFDAADLPTRIAGTVDCFDPEPIIGRKEARRMDRATQMAVAAARMAVDDAGLSAERFDPYKVGVCLGSGMGAMLTLEQEIGGFLSGGPHRVGPLVAPMMIPNMPAGYVSIHLGLRGPIRALATACATGSDCIGEAFEMIRAGRVPIVVAGGVEAPVSRFVIAAFASCRALSRRNDEPTRASRPFDRDRDGFVIAEGAGIVVLEDLDHAQARGARIYAEIRGYGSTADAYHLTAPDATGEPMARAMQLALAEAGLPAHALDYINAHGTSTPLNDRCETLAIKRALGAHAYRLPISSTKSMTGHLIGAAGAVELIATILSIRDGFVHPTINLDCPDPACDLDYVPNIGRPHRIAFAMSNSLAFGGHNASLIVAHPDAV